MYEVIIARAQELVKCATYKPKHRREWMDEDLTDNQRAWVAIVVGFIVGLMLGGAIFSGVN